MASHAESVKLASNTAPAADGRPAAREACRDSLFFLDRKSALRLNAGSVWGVASAFEMTFLTMFLRVLVLSALVVGEVLVGALLVPSLAQASTTRNPRFDRIAVDQGLSHNTVNAVIQDKLGFLWIAT